jgi:hypothetical protein
MDKATDLLKENVNKVPSDVDRQVTQIKELFAERFTSIASEFKNIGNLTDKLTEANKTAIEAAFDAAKEAVAKSEASFIKQLDGLRTTIENTEKTVDSKISDIKERITILESRLTGIRTARLDQQSSVGTLVAIAVALISLVGLVMSLLAKAS